MYDVLLYTFLFLLSIAMVCIDCAILYCMIGALVAPNYIENKERRRKEHDAEIKAIRIELGLDHE